MNYTRRLGVGTLLLAAPFLTCKSNDRAVQLTDTTELPGPQQNVAGTGGSGGAPATAGTGGTGGSAPTATNCGEVQCSGAGKCIEEDGVASCVCDEGYTLEDAVCVVDETCIRLRGLEPGCRQLVEREPALAMVFNVETCAGTTVRADVLGNVSQAFKVLEDDNDLGDESYAAVFRRSNVESDIVIAIDLSTSVTTDPGLVQSMFASLDVLIDDLTPAPGEAKIYVELIAFGRSVDLALGFTDDMASVKQKLAELEADLDSAVANPVGTNLNGVINTGVLALEDAWRYRYSATGGSVLSTGTLITITDGVDTGGEGLEDIPPRWNLISIGVSNDIDDAELTRIGRNGSFLAPTSEDRVSIFEKVAQRVAEYPSRAYLLAYCSPTVAGDHDVLVTLAAREANLAAGCSFDAEVFAAAGGVCNAAFVDNYCAADHGCGTFLACGTCQPDGGINPEDDWILPDDD
jgi:hypothetical protein